MAYTFPNMHAVTFVAVMTYMDLSGSSYLMYTGTGMVIYGVIFVIYLSKI